MGKKAKANRTKATVVGAAGATVSTATVAPTAATASVVVAVVDTRYKVRVPFLESTFFIKAETFFKKGNHSKARRIYLQGIENGCVLCLDAYGCQILLEGITGEIASLKKLSRIILVFV